MKTVRRSSLVASTAVLFGLLWLLAAAPANATKTCGQWCLAHEPCAPTTCWNNQTCDLDSFWCGLRGDYCVYECYYSTTSCQPGCL